MTLRRLLTALTSAALLAAVLVATPPAHSVDTGTLVLKLVDEKGDPVPGAFSIFGPEGRIPSGGEGQGVSTWRQDLPTGAYGAAVAHPWAGILCEGISPCDYFLLTSGAAPDGSLRVRADRTSTVVFEAVPPATVRGKGAVGSPLRLDWSPGMTRFIDAFGSVSGGALAPQVQWLRDGHPVAGATEEIYRPRSADAGSAIAARLSYSSAAEQQFEILMGAVPGQRATRAVEVGRVATRTFAVVGDPTIPAGRQSRVRVEVTAPDRIVTGDVRVDVGEWSRTVALRNGSARVVLPRLPVGRHVVRAAYLGSSVYAPSTAAAKTVTVGR